MQKKTKILAIGDIHGDKGLVKKLAVKATRENVDLIIIAGDLTFFELSYDGLISPFIKAEKEVLIIPGNHESNEFINYLSKIYGIKNINGCSFKKGDLGIFGVGWADVGPYSVSEKEIFSLLKKGHFQVKDTLKKIMVTHMHHKGGKSEEMTGIGGSESIYKALKEIQPDFLVSAHLHETGGLEEQFQKTKIINVSKKEKIFDI